MKQLLLYFTILFIAFVACDKLPSNGDLDGMWHLQKVTKLDASPMLEEDVSTKKFYWNFQLNLLMINSLGEVMYEDKASGLQIYKAFARFEHSGNQLNVNKIYLHMDVRDSLITDSHTTMFERYGIMGNADSFYVERLDHKWMVLVSNSRRLQFRKF